MKLNLNFKVNSKRSQQWFYLDLGLIEVNFSTHEIEFYKKLFQSHDDTQYINIFRLFEVPIGNAKFVESSKFQNDSPILKYCQKSLNSCCFSLLASAFVCLILTKADAKNWKKSYSITSDNT